MKHIYCGCDAGANLAFVGFCEGKWFSAFAKIKGQGLDRRMAIQQLYGEFMEHTYDYDKPGFQLHWAIGKPFVGRFAVQAMAHGRACEAVSAIIDTDGKLTQFLDTEARRIVFGKSCDKQGAVDEIIDKWWPDLPYMGKGKNTRRPNEHLADGAVFALALASRSGVTIQRYRK